MKQAVEQAGDKITEDEKQTVKSRCDETIKWMDGNLLAEKEEVDHRMKELTQVCSPIMTKMHGGAQQQQPPPKGGKSGPNVEEVD